MNPGEAVMKMVDQSDSEFGPMPLVSTVNMTSTVGQLWPDVKPRVIETIRLHVSNIPFRFGENELRTLFGKYGAVLDAQIISNSRGSKGFGFVTMGKEESELARRELDGTVCEGRTIHINMAKARPPKPVPATPQIQGTLAERVAAAHAHMLLQNNILAQSLLTQGHTGLIPGLGLPSYPLGLINGQDRFFADFMQIMLQSQQAAMATLLPQPRIQNLPQIPIQPIDALLPTVVGHTLSNPSPSNHPPGTGGNRYTPY